MRKTLRARKEQVRRVTHCQLVWDEERSRGPEGVHGEAGQRRRWT